MTDKDRRAARPWWVVPPPPWWLWLAFVAADAGTGVWQAIAGNGAGRAQLFFGGLFWPGLVIAAVVAAVVWLGWSLDLG